MKNKNAFTLSEVLITLGILGIVAALTIPILMQNYQRQANITLLRKTINDFANAADMYITEEGKTKLSQTGILDTDGIEKFMTEKFKAIQKSDFEDYYYSISNKKKKFTCSGKAYVLPSGAAVCIKTEKELYQDEVSQTGKVHTVLAGVYAANLHVYVDVNGPNKKPNIGGRDMFDFYIDNNGSAATSIDIKYEEGYSYQPETCGSSSCTDCIDKPFGEGCYKLLQDNNWKMNY